MPELDVDGAVFCFPDGWEASKFDEWAYFRSVMSRIVDPLGRASHGCDVVALHDGDLWLIEAKDYSHPDAVPPSDLVAVVCEKSWTPWRASTPGSVTPIRNVAYVRGRLPPPGCSSL